MSGPTTGPWMVGIEVEDTGEIEVVSNERPYICMVLPGAIADSTRANARLIAAAPELLDALERALTCMEAGASLEHGAGYEVFKDSPIEAARAAIAKATQP